MYKHKGTRSERAKSGIPGNDVHRLFPMKSVLGVRRLKGNIHLPRVTFINYTFHLSPTFFAFSRDH